MRGPGAACRLHDHEGLEEDCLERPSDFFPFSSFRYLFAVISSSLYQSLFVSFFSPFCHFFSGWKVFFLHPDVALFSHRPAQWPLGRCCPRARPADLGPGAVWDPGGFSSEVLKSATLLQKTPSDQVPDKRIIWKPAVFNIRTVVFFFFWMSGGHGVLSSFKWFHSPLFIPFHHVPQTQHFSFSLSNIILIKYHFLLL